MTRYRVPVSDPLLLERESWGPVEGLRLVSVDGPWLSHPDVTICTFEDDNAPAELEGKLVEPVLRRNYGVAGQVADAVVISRRVIPS